MPDLGRRRSARAPDIGSWYGIGPERPRGDRTGNQDVEYEGEAHHEPGGSRRPLHYLPLSRLSNARSFGFEDTARALRLGCNSRSLLILGSPGTATPLARRSATSPMTLQLRWAVVACCTRPQDAQRTRHRETLIVPQLGHHYFPCIADDTNYSTEGKSGYHITAGRWLCGNSDAPGYAGRVMERLNDV